MKYNRPALRITGLAAAIAAPIVLLTMWSIAQEKPEAPMKEKTAKEQFKNIKVLKDLPANKLIPVMHQFNDSLGVKCDFCHVMGPNHTGFEKDDKPAKDMARKMILMTNSINKSQKLLGGQATCFMCHHGSPEPQTHPKPEGK